MEYKKLKLEDLINKAGEKKGDKYVEIYIKRLDATIKAKEPDNTLILESIDILKENFEQCLRIPTNDKIRALNLSNTVAIMIYEALRQQNFNDLLREEPEGGPFKGADYLER